MQEETKNDGQLDCKLLRGLADEMESNIATAVRVLDDLLYFDKIQTGTFRLELGMVRIWDLLDQLLKEFQSLADEKHIQLSHHQTMSKVDSNHNGDLEAPPGNQMDKLVVVGDHIRLAQVIRNLLSNALKFTPRGGRIVVETGFSDVTFQEEEMQFKLATGDEVILPRHGNITINVIDTGVGMSQDQLGKLFSRRASIQCKQASKRQGQWSWALHFQGYCQSTQRTAIRFIWWYRNGRVDIYG